MRCRCERSGGVSHRPAHARKIDMAHREVIYAGKSMLQWAKDAGRHLLMAKEKVRHGEFKAWIAENCGCSYETAKEYMRVAKRVEVHPFDPEMGVRAFLDATSTPRPKTPCPTVTTIDRGRIAAFWDDAAHALKLRTSHHFPHHHPKGHAMTDWLCSLSLCPSLAAHVALASSLALATVPA